jgi:CubicO group peptidase (beta-lactamase class C family)
MTFDFSRRSHSIKRRDFLRLAALGSAGALIGFRAHPCAAVRPLWPTEEWPVSTPEAQGMDSVKLAGMFTFFAEEDYRVKSLLVIRNGHIVAEAYSPDIPQDEPIDLGCASRGFINTLAGIALADGLIESLDQPVLSFFPDRTFENLDEKKEAITVEDVLTEQTGLQWDWSADGSAIQASDDWLQYVLDKPVDDSVSYPQQAHAHLMAAIVESAAQAATGESALVLAQKRLFDPLGIADVTWDTTPEGVPSFLGLHLTPRDMAKWGYLYLNQGLWDDQQIVSADWVAASTTAQVPMTSAGMFWTWGYLLHVYNLGAYAAQGNDNAGTSSKLAVAVIPEANVVLAFYISKRRVGSCTMVKTLCEDHVIPAAVSTDSLPENPGALADLQALIEAVATEE